MTPQETDYEKTDQSRGYDAESYGFAGDASAYQPSASQAVVTAHPCETACSPTYGRVQASEPVCDRSDWTA